MQKILHFSEFLDKSRVQILSFSQNELKYFFFSTFTHISHLLNYVKTRFTGFICWGSSFVKIIH